MHVCSIFHCVFGTNSCFISGFIFLKGSPLLNDSNIINMESTQTPHIHPFTCCHILFCLFHMYLFVRLCSFFNLWMVWCRFFFFWFFLFRSFTHSQLIIIETINSFTVLVVTTIFLLLMISIIDCHQQHDDVQHDSHFPFSFLFTHSHRIESIVSLTRSIIEHLFPCLAIIFFPNWSMDFFGSFVYWTI